MEEEASWLGWYDKCVKILVAFGGIAQRGNTNGRMRVDGCWGQNVFEDAR